MCVTGCECVFCVGAARPTAVGTQSAMWLGHGMFPRCHCTQVDDHCQWRDIALNTHKHECLQEAYVQDGLRATTGIEKHMCRLPLEGGVSAMQTQMPGTTTVQYYPLCQWEGASQQEPSVPVESHPGRATAAATRTLASRRMPQLVTTHGSNDV